MDALLKVQDGFIVFNNSTIMANKSLLNQISQKELYDILRCDYLQNIIDEDATIALNNEINLYKNPIKSKNQYKNNLKSSQNLEKSISNLFEKDIRNGFKFYIPKYEISDDLVPKIIKDMGYELQKKVHLIKLSWDEEDKEVQFFDFINKKNIDIFDVKFASVADRSVFINDLVFILNKKDAELVAKNIEKIANMPNVDAEGLTDKGSVLAFYVNAYVNDLAKEKDVILVHELHHIITEVLVSSRRSKNDNGKLSLKDIYKLNIHDEISANFAETLLLVEKYHKAKNYSDLSVFNLPKFKGLKAMLKKTPVENRKKMVMDMDFLISENLENCRENLLESYYGKNNQFELSLKKQINCGSLSKISETDNKEEYFKQKSLMYRYNIYNPDTEKHEYINLTKHLKKEVIIPRGDIANVINPLKKEVTKKKDKLKDMGITDEVVKKCKREFKAVNNKNIREIKVAYQRIHLNKNPKR